VALVGVLAAVLLLEVPAGNDPHFPWKYAALLIGTGVALVLAVPHLWSERARPRLALPAVLVVTFLAALIIRGLVADVPFESALVGTLYRYDGIVMYTALAVLFLLSWQYLSAWTLLRALVVVAAVVAVWALLTAPAGDPLLGAYATGERQALESTLGNANFLAAFLALAVGPCLSVALHRPDTWRWTALVTLLAISIALPLTRSLQAVPVALASAVLVVLVWGESRDGRVRPAVRSGLGVAAVLGVAGVAALVAGVGPAAGVRASEIGTVQARGYYWEVAADIVADRPLVGAGPAQYRNEFSPRRSVEAAVDRPFDAVDAPHNVPLKLAAENGLVVAALYAGFVLSVGWVLVRGLLRLRGPARLALAGIGAAWLGYQIQSLVSIEVVPLATVHWIAAGALLGIAALPPFAGSREVPVRRALVVHKPLAIALAALLLLALPLLLRPMRADLTAAGGLRAAATGDVRAAERGFEQARELAPYEPEYAFLAGRGFEQLGQQAAALQYYEAAAQQEPGNPRYQLGATRVAAALGQPETMLERAAGLLASDPHNPALLAEVVRLRLQTGREDEALQASTRLTAVLPGSADAWLLRGRSAVAAGDDDQARRAFEAALRLEPNNAEAQSALEGLASAAAGSS
jgi:tetratricopeptide (TPR) repeat protein